MATTQHLSDPFTIPGGNVDTNGKTSSQPGYKSNSPINNTYKADIPTPTGQTAGTNPNNPVAVYRTGVTQPIGTITSQSGFIPNPSYLLSNTGGNLSTQELTIRKAEQRAIREKTIEINKQVITPTAKKEKIDPPIKSNDAATPPDRTGTNGTPETSGTLNDQTQKALIKELAGTPPRKTYEDLRYPLDIQSSNSDVINFTMSTYTPLTLSSSSSNQAIGFDKNIERFTQKSIEGSVTMSIQPPVMDSNGVGWGDTPMNVLIQAAAKGSLTFMDTGDAGKAFDASGVGKIIQDPNAQEAFTAILAGQASGAKGLLTKLTGATINPNLELLFTGPQLRPFNFTFKMSPREGKETEQVKKIIRFFKQGMAVQRTANNLFLKSPNVFQIKYLYKNKEDHPYLPKIKTCALQQCDVNYTPQNSYMTFAEDGGMVSYEITLQFKELEPVYEDDYQTLDKGTNDSAGVGY